MLPRRLFGKTKGGGNKEILAREKPPPTNIVKVKTVGFNQEGTVVISFERTIMVYKKGRATEITRLTPDEG